MQVRISKPTKSAMQSADGDDSWLLEFVTDSNSKFKEKLMEEPHQATCRTK